MLIIHAIRGKVLRVKDSTKEKDKDGNEILNDYTIAPRAEVTINGQKKALADLDNGDVVRISAGNKDGFHKIEATRAGRKQAPAVNGPDHSKPQKVSLPRPDLDLSPTGQADEKTKDGHQTNAEQPQDAEGASTAGKGDGDKNEAAGTRSAAVEGDGDGDDAEGTGRRDASSGKKVTGPAKEQNAHARSPRGQMAHEDVKKKH